MNTSDELIQKQVEEGSASFGADADAYKVVFNSLKKEPGIKLSADFAYKVSQLASSPEKSFNWEKFLLISGGIGFIIALIYAIVSVEATFSFGIFTFLSSNQGLLVFGIIFILGLNWLDKKLTHSRPQHT
jgi:hypothetical protein